MIFKHQQLGETLTLECLTDITVRNAGLFKLAVGSFSSEGVSIVQLNLQRVRAVDSSGLCALISCRKMLRDLGVQLVLLHPPESLRQLFAVTRTEPLFELGDDQFNLHPAVHLFESALQFEDSSPSLSAS